MKLYSISATILLVIITLGFNQLISCDLQQASDEKKVDQSDGQLTNDDQEQQQRESPSDPEVIKRELKEVIRRSVDSDKDGSVSYEELKKYLADLHDRTVEFNVEKQWRIYAPQIHEVFSWEGYEPEKQEVLTWDHYYNQTYPELIGVDVGVPINREQDTARILNSPDEEKKKDSEKKPEEKPEDDYGIDPHMKSLRLMVARADARWKLADENGDTLLTRQEFKFLLHPDEGYGELQNLFVKEATEDMDANKDGKICLEEFMKHLQVLATEQERNDRHWLANQQENFGRFLDKNKDGVLDKEEIHDWLVPPKSKKFEAEAKRLMDMGDTNEDHNLSTAEIMEHFEQYLSLLPPEYWDKISKEHEEESATTKHEYVYTDDVQHDEL